MVVHRPGKRKEPDYVNTTGIPEKDVYPECVCRICGKDFRNLRQLSDHWKEEHGNT